MLARGRTKPVGPTTCTYPHLACTLSHIGLYPPSPLADVVVGQHGAQLYNALFMPQHKALVEVRPHGFVGVSAG
jgi:capsular polysaccharide biosynthesis protein